MRIAAAAVIVALAVGLVACTDSDGGGSRKTAGATTPAPSQQTKKPAPESGRSATFDVIKEVDTAAALSATADKKFESRYTAKGTAPGGHTYTALDVTSDGRLVVADNPAPETEAGELRIGQSGVGLHGPAGFRPFPRAQGDCKARPRQAIYADESDGLIAWTESASTDLYYSDWCVFVHDTRKNSTRLLGDSAPLGKKLPAPPGASIPTIGNKNIFWTVTHPTTDKRKFGVKVVSSPRTGTGKVEDAVTRAKLPVASGNDLYYVRSEDVSPGFPKDRFEVRKLSGTGEDSLVAAGALKGEQQLSVLAVAGKRVTWVISQPEDETAGLYSLDETTDKALLVKLHHPGLSTMALSVTPETITWGNGSSSGDAGQYVFDLGDQRLWRIGTEEGYSIVFAKGDFLAWSQFPNSQGAGPVSFRTAKWE